jgi:outer membrane protein assembly factor BamB
VANGFVYVSSYGGKLFAFDATAGNPRWAAVVSSGSASDPAMANGIVYISSRKGELQASMPLLASFAGLYPLMAALSTSY